MKLSFSVSSAVATAVLLVSALSVDAFRNQPALEEPGRIKPKDCPNGVRQRQELRALTDDQRKRFFDAMRTLQSGKGPTRYDDYPRVHDANHKYSHGNSIFLPWHRRFQRELEIDLQLIDKSIMLPYWDWSIDSQAPEKSFIFRADYFGGNGRKSDNCVTDGVFKDWRPSYPKPGCLRRKFDKGNKIRVLSSTEIIQNIITSSGNFTSFAKRIEGAPHSRVHYGIGGIMSTMYSPADPIFFMHHGMLDKVWWQWQQAKPKYLRSFSGKMKDNSTATPDIKMKPWNDLTVADVLDTRDLCYTYASLPANKVETPPNDVVRTQPNPTSTEQPTSDQAPVAEEEVNAISLVRRSYGEERDPLPDLYRTYGDANDRLEERKAKRRYKKCKCHKSAEPVDEGNDVPLTESTTHASITPTSDNRESLTKTRLPPPIPRDWLVMNGQSVDEVRRHEAEDKVLYDQLNSIPGYVSPCALINRGDIISSLVQAGQTVFTAGYGRERVPVVINSTSNVVADIEQVVQDVRKQVVSYITTNPFDPSQTYNATNVVEQVTNLIGSPEDAGVTLRSAENFLLSAARDYSAGWVPIEQSLATLEDEEECQEDDVEDQYEEEEEVDCEEEPAPEPEPCPETMPYPEPEPTPIATGEEMAAAEPTPTPCNKTAVAYPAPVVTDYPAAVTPIEAGEETSSQQYYPEPEPMPVPEVLQYVPEPEPIQAGDEQNVVEPLPQSLPPVYVLPTPVEPAQPALPTPSPCNKTAPAQPVQYNTESTPVEAGQDDIVAEQSQPAYPEPALEATAQSVEPSNNNDNYYGGGQNDTEVTPDAGHQDTTKIQSYAVPNTGNKSDVDDPQPVVANSHPVEQSAY